MSDDNSFAQPDGADETADAAPEIGSQADGGTEQLRAEANEWRDKAMRAVAEAENTRRRAEREMNDARAFAIQRFAKDLLDAADNLERALAAAPKDTGDAALHNFIVGVEMTEKALQTGFERNGMKKIESSRGTRFDPHLHQAVMEQPDPEVEGGAIIQAFQPGYELYGRVIRPAMVVVAAKGAGQGAGQAAAQPQPAPDDQPAGDAGVSGYGRAGGPTGGAFDTKA